MRLCRSPLECSVAMVKLLYSLVVVRRLRVLTHPALPLTAKRSRFRFFKQVHRIAPAALLKLRATVESGGVRFTFTEMPRPSAGTLLLQPVPALARQRGRYVGQVAERLVRLLPSRFRTG